MATTKEQIDELRAKIGEPENADPYSDDTLSELIDALGINGAAQRVWEGKAAGVAHLMDISEGGSSRKASSLYKQYLEFADRAGAAALAEKVSPVVAGGPRTSKAVRA